MRRGYISIDQLTKEPAIHLTLLPELSDEIKPPKPPSKAKKYMRNEDLPKQDPSYLTRKNLWDTEEQCRWMMDEGDFYDAEIIRYGSYSPSIDAEYDGNLIKEAAADPQSGQPAATKSTPIERKKKNVKSTTQLSLF